MRKSALSRRQTVTEAPQVSKRRLLSERWQRAILGAFATLLCGFCVIVIAASQLARDQIDAFLSSQVQATTVALQASQLRVLEEISARQAIAIGVADPIRATSLAQDLASLEATRTFLDEAIAAVGEDDLTPEPQVMPATVFSRTTPTPAFPTVGVSQELVIEELNTQSVFDTSIYVTVLEASSRSNEVTAVIYTPGYPPLLVERMNVGFKVVYESIGDFEMLILGFGGSFVDSARLQVTYLGPASGDQRIEGPSESRGIGEADSAAFFGGQLIISVLVASERDDTVSLIASSSGAESSTLSDLSVGDVFRYEAREIYEILVAGYGVGFQDSVVLIASRLR